jgi:hypothetical protein
MSDEKWQALSNEVLDRIEEPCFGGDAQPDRPFSWANYKDIPPVLVARLRLAS